MLSDECSNRWMTEDVRQPGAGALRDQRPSIERAQIRFGTGALPVCLDESSPFIDGESLLTTIAASLCELRGGSILIAIAVLRRTRMIRFVSLSS
jgi:hypothetical protein